MSRFLFSLSDPAWVAIEPHLPQNQPKAQRIVVQHRRSGRMRKITLGWEAQTC